MRRLTVVTGFLSTVLLATALTTPAAGQERIGTKPADVVYQRAVFAAGASDGTGTADGLSFAAAAGTTSYTDALGTRTWEYARWTGPERTLGFPATELIASWTADDPAGSWLQVEARARNGSGLTKWYVLGRWAYGDGDIRRTSVRGQGDADANGGRRHVRRGEGQADRRLPATGHALPDARLRRWPRACGPSARWPPACRSAKKVPVSPARRRVGDRAERPAPLPERAPGPLPGVGRRRRGLVQPDLDRDGARLLGPVAEREGHPWVDPSDPDPEVDHAARYTYDHAYEGAGNWPFNTAYAGRYGVDGFVTRLRSLTELERLIGAGIPVITSQSFRKGELPGAGYGTNGHLMVVVGFTANGDVIANDPASPSNDARAARLSDGPPSRTSGCAAPAAAASSTSSTLLATPCHRPRRGCPPTGEDLPGADHVPNPGGRAVTSVITERGRDLASCGLETGALTGVPYRVLAKI